MDKNPTPNVTSASEITPTQAPEQTTAQKSNQQSNRKSKKTGLIVGIIAGILVCGGIVAAILLLGGKKDPNNIVYNALTNLIGFKDNTAKDETFSGTISAEAFGVSIFDLDLDGKSNQSNAEFNLKFKTSALLGAIDANANFVVGKDNIFAKITGTDELVEAFDLGIDLSSIEDEWYQINMSEITEYIQESESAVNEKNTNECISRELESLADKNQELSNIYKDHKFISAKEYTGGDIKSKKDTIYEVSIDKGNLVDFINSIFGESDLLLGFYNCIGKTADNIGTISPEIFADLEIPTFYTEINHEKLTRLYLPLEIEGVSIVIDLSIEYPAKVEILKPTNAKSINDLITDLMSLTPYYDDYDYDFDYDLEF